jgi:hypothetical protein
MTELEYLKRRVALNEEVLVQLGQLIAAHLPAICPQLQNMGKLWDKEIDDLDAEAKF